MNLKQAALRLGIHYQTAYKLVRSGALTAVRVGRRYEISEAAIARYEERRDAVHRDAFTPGPPAPVRGAPDVDIRVRLQDLARRPFLDLEHSLNHVARLLSEAMGDMCLLATVDDASKRIEFTIAFEADALRIPVHSMVPVLVSRTRLVPDAPLLQMIGDGHPLLFTHVPQDGLRSVVPPEFHQYLDEWRVFSAIAAPITCDDDVIGGIAMMRERPDMPYDQPGADRLADIGRIVGVIVGRAREDVEVRLSRDRLSAELSSVSALEDLDAGNLQEMVDDHAVAAAIRRIGGPWIVTNAAWDDLRSTRPQVGPDSPMDDPAAPPRLLSGELDYFDETVSGRVIHHVAIRDVDTAVRFVVSVARSIDDSWGN